MEALSNQFELLIGLAVLAVVIILLATLFIARRGRTRRGEEQRERTRQEFGEEFEREARERGSEEEAERELRKRRGRMERQVRDLSDEDRRRYEERWEEVERVFVENPERSVELADRVVSDLLDERNFVSDAAQEDEETERDLAAVYPQVAGEYREARRIRADVVSRASRGEGSEEGGSSADGPTEELRQAIRRYRSVYERLVEG